MYDQEDWMYNYSNLPHTLTYAKCKLGEKRFDSLNN